MSPKEAYARLVTTGEVGFDDPQICWYPVRWYWGPDGVLRRCVHGGYSESYPAFRRPQRQEAASA
jgi:hypothetical protein